MAEISELTQEDWERFVEAQKKLCIELEPSTQELLVKMTVILPRAIYEEIRVSVTRKGSLYDSEDDWILETLRRRLGE